MRESKWCVVFAVAGGSMVGGCGDGQSHTISTGTGGYNYGGSGGGSAGTGTGGSGGLGIPPGAGVGEACSAATDCRAGLTCNASGTCEPGHATAENGACVLSAECATGLQCLAGHCQAEGSGTSGASCRGDGDCKAGLRCALVGFSAQCVPEGTTDVGGTCTTSADCYSGLACVAGTCNLIPPGAPSFGLPSWTGVDCEDTSSVTPVRAYFEVPGAAAAQTHDFFRLPFPNDARISGGTIDLDGFPTPGTDLLGFDPLKIYVDAITAGESAWGAYPTTIFRFSGAIDFSTFTAQSSGPSPVQYLDITPSTPQYGTGGGARWLWDPNRNHYICANWIGIRRPEGAPLTPGHTYAVWITTAGRAADGSAIERAPNFVSMLSDTAPTDAALSNAYSAFKPLRDYLTAKSIDPTTLMTGTVFTVAAERASMTALAAAVQAAPAPTSKSWVKCGVGVTSPCPDATGNRACGDGSAAEYDEYHALVTLPIFQQGTAPYLTPADGGGITTSAPVRTEDVCMALTVPKGTMPTAGWPLVVYAHGTGGSFRDHVRPEVAGALANAAMPSGNVTFAVLGIDQVEHGPRRGGSTQSPNDLFFNFGNPAAARGNPLQGAADQLALGRFASTLDLTAAQTGGAAIRIDPGKIVFFGHSQGSTEGSLALPFGDTYKGSVLSGDGASLIDALLGKTQPANIAGALPFILEDYDNNGALPDGNMHPALNILQQWIDPADPLNFASAIGAAPITGHTAKPMFQTYGLGDHYSPPVTLATFAIAARVKLAAADVSVTTPDAIGSLTEQALPLTGNPTLAVRQYAPATGGEGHFVVFDVASANADAVRFLAMSASGVAPQVGP